MHFPQIFAVVMIIGGLIHYGFGTWFNLKMRDGRSVATYIAGFIFNIAWAAILTIGGFFQ